MNFCEQTDLADYLLQAYITKIDEISPGSTLSQVETVSAEIAECLKIGGYGEAAETTALLRRICAVIVAWRCVAEITTLMETEAVSSNEWLPLQRQYNDAVKDLRDIRDGKLDPFPGVADSEGGDVQVSAPDRLFSDEVLEEF